ncbi:MAG: hypothetical protein Unbinned838contig1000_40 [Prokaryotic dsDNA virus sp.]|nr:MAG: hypothetical protein Unbinned838contig1000_40 [Prokaryotic dsDNA virus sp.]|tara:strand:+ start:2005 stop:3693 length:1689 start_codon:yes stop_codon:yes gene_type:complete
MAKKKSRFIEHPKQKSLYPFSLPGGTMINFATKKDKERIQYLSDLLLQPGKDNKPQKTNLDPAVRLTNDNPLLNATPAAGGLITKIEAIPTKEFNKKYKLPEAGYAKKVQASNPRLSNVKPKAKEKEVKKETPVKTWVGPPYTTEELLPQNLRYTMALSANSSSQSNCPTCTGQIGKYVKVNDCDGNGPYHFPCAVFEGGTPTNAILGVPVSCAPPGNPYHYPCASTCWGSQWIPIQISDCNPAYNECSSLKQDPVCITTVTPSCASPGQQAINRSASGALDACAMVTAYVTSGSFGWDNINRGIFVVPSTMNAPGVGFQLMNEEDCYNMINAAISGPPFNLNGTLSSNTGSVAKFGNKIYTSFTYTPIQGSSIRLINELEIDPTGTTVTFSNMYGINVGSFMPGNSFCSMGVNKLLNNEGFNIYQIDLDPGTSTFTKTLLFATDQTQPAGDMVYDPTTDTIWIAQMGQPNVIKHYDINGTVLGSIATTSVVVSLWCEAGEILFYSGGDLQSIDKTNYTLVPVHSTYPYFPNNNGGDAASDPTCCGASSPPPQTCATPNQQA